MSAILPIFRVTTQAHPTIGTHTATLDGIYEITFDNTYSRSAPSIGQPVLSEADFNSLLDRL